MLLTLSSTGHFSFKQLAFGKKLATSFGITPSHKNQSRPTLDFDKVYYFIHQILTMYNSKGLYDIFLPCEGAKKKKTH